jgi:hypothetical protein
MFEEWLFEERVSYTEALTRAEKEWGVTGSKTSVHRFYRRVEADRAVNDLEELTEAAERVNAAEGRPAGLKASAMKLVGMHLLERAIGRGDVKELAALSRVLTQDEDRQIERGRLALAQKRFEFKAAKEVLKHAAALNKITEASQAREDEELDAAKLAIFGRPPPGYEDAVTDSYA